MTDLYFWGESINFTEIKGVLNRGVQNVDYIINKKFSKLRNSFGAFRSSHFNSDKCD